MPQEYLSALMQLFAGFGFAGLILILSVLFGRRSKLRSAQELPYECGNVPEGDGAPSFFSIKYYLVAVLFLVFDLEVIFLYPWALAFKGNIMQNPAALLGTGIFVMTLMAVYFYALVKGVITWHRNPDPARKN